MSLKTWKQEFYPVCAKAAKDALEHSIQKWTGMLPENLAKHAVTIQHGDYRRPRIVEKDEPGSFLQIDGSTCALCAQFVKGGDCDACPLFQVHRMQCDADTPEKVSPWKHFIRNRDVQPMLNLLYKAKKEKAT